jgi:hypothetical protein
LVGSPIERVKRQSVDPRNAFGILLIAAGLVAVPISIVPRVPLIAAGMALLRRHRLLICSWRAWLHKQGFLKESPLTPNSAILAKNDGGAAPPILNPE